MSISALSNRGGSFQFINDLRWSAPNSNILVRDANTGKRKRLLDEYGELIRVYKGGLK